MSYQDKSLSSNKSIESNTKYADSYWYLFWTFLKIGSTAFGGFMALISVVQNYVVDRKNLLSQEEMLDGISLATILPGPVAVNVVAYCGYKIRGLTGALVCSVAVILPSFLLLLGFSYAYLTWGEMPVISRVFSGVLPAVAAIIIVAAINMGKKTVTGLAESLIAITSMLGLIFIGGFYSSLVLIMCSGLLGYFIYPHNENNETAKSNQINKLPNNIQVTLMASVLLVGVSVFKANTLILAKIFSTFATMSLLLFGGGFVFIPLIQEVVVDSYGWVNHKEFIDAIALGQITPGPILISATFIGYKVAGIIGASIATIGIFAPPALVMLICTNYLDRIKKICGN